MRIKLNYIALAFIALSVLLAGCGGGGGGGGSLNGSRDGSRHWTIMIYMAADNNLEEYAIQDINELEQIGSTPEVSIVVQLDRSSGYDTSNGNWTGARRYYITKDNDPTRITSTLITDMGSQNMASPDTLHDFINWATTTYPTQNTMLILWDHGRGWRTLRTTMATVQREVKAIFVDDTSNSEMSIGGLNQALQTSTHTNVVVFDACLMSMLEVAYSIKDESDIMISSEDNIPATGQQYNLPLARLVNNPGLTPYEISHGIVDDYVDYNSTHYNGAFSMSAIDLTSLGSVVTASDQLAQAIIANPTDKGGIREAQQQAQHFDFDKNYYSEYKDLYDFARLAKDNVSSDQIKNAAQGVMNSVNAIVLYQKHSGSDAANAHGISIYISDPNRMLPEYRDLAFSSNTQWDEFLASY